MELDSGGMDRMRRILRHRLLNFVSGIKSANVLLANELDDRLLPRQREYFPMIQQECDHIAIMINRIEALFTEVPAAAPAELQESVQSALVELQGIHPTLEIVLDVDSSLYETKRLVCSHALKAVLQESIANAHELSRKPVTISITNSGEACSMCIMDEGKPLSEDAAAMAFEPFYTTRPRHVGVGLSIARRIVADRGGSVSISSDEHGNCVECVLPFMQVSD